MSDTVTGKIVTEMTSHKFRIASTVIACIGMLTILPGCERRDWQAERAQAEQQRVAVAERTERQGGAASEEPGKALATSSQARPATGDRMERSSNTSSSGPTGDTATNKYVQLSIASIRQQASLGGTSAIPGSEFLVVETLWENIHPKQKVAKDKLEGKVDRTMGVGGLGAGGGSSKPVEYVEMDVAYKVPNLGDHVFVVADGRAIPLHAQTESLPHGIDPGAPFGIARLGETKELQFAFLVPEDAENVAVQVFDFANGHLFIGVRGNAEVARRSNTRSSEVLDSVTSAVLTLAAHGLSFADSYDNTPAGDGWRFAIVSLVGQGVYVDGEMGSIVQVDPTEYMWINADGGYIYYASAGTTNRGGKLRFTPDFDQQQEVAFRVPADIDRLSMGLRVNRDVFNLSLTRQEPREMPKPKAGHKDGDVMEVVLHGMRTEGDLLILDLGIKPIMKGQGLEIRTSQQFLLQTPDGELRPDAKATALLTGHPPDPFVVPPGVAVRFELAFKPSSDPTALRVRGFRSEGSLAL